MIPTTIEIDSSLDDVILYSNPTWLVQIFFNLIINAAQAVKSLQPATYKGHKITISAEIQTDYIVVSVSDTGPGIPKDYVDSIFRPYFTSKSTGTGLGLSICKSLAEKLHSTIGFSNKTDDSMTQFWLKLPLKKP